MHIRFPDGAETHATNTDSFDRIETDPAVMMGKPVIAGTRITVASIRDRRAAGESVDDVLAAHPRLELADVRAAQDWASSDDEAATVERDESAGRV